LLLTPGLCQIQSISFIKFDFSGVLNKMPKITADTANGIVAFEAEQGRKLVLCLEDNGVDILHRCGGNAKCTTCRVEVLSGDPGEIGEPERAILATKTDLNDHTRLSCQVRVIDDLHIKVVRQASVEGIPAGNRPVE
jgi:ferredoxin